MVRLDDFEGLLQHQRCYDSISISTSVSWQEQLINTWTVTSQVWLKWGILEVGGQHFHVIPGNLNGKVWSVDTVFWRLLFFFRCLLVFSCHLALEYLVSRKIAFFLTLIGDKSHILSRIWIIVVFCSYDSQVIELCSFLLSQIINQTRCKIILSNCKKENRSTAISTSL